MISNELIFIEDKNLGILTYHNVYAYYGEPLIFTALDQFGRFYFCYSLGEENNSDLWIVVPTSEELVNKLEQKDIPIIKMLVQSAVSKVYLLSISLENLQTTSELVVASKLSFELPSEDVFISNNVNYDGSRQFTHRIRIALENSNRLTTKILSSLSDAFSSVCEALQLKFIPKDAVIGSFVYRVKTKIRNDAVPENSYELLSQVANRERFLSHLDNRCFDLKSVNTLFNLLEKYKATIQLIDENSTQKIVELNYQYANEVIPDIQERLSSYLDSSMVPQANDIETVKKYVELLNKNNIVTADSLGIVDRQVAYYYDACRILNLVDNYRLTPTGIKVAKLKSKDEWLNILKEQFEKSYCGYFWMIKSGVDNILNIDENSAEDFILNNVSGLSANTAKRRATTIRKWIQEFKSLY